MSFSLHDGPAAFLDAYVARVQPLRRRHGDAYWRFATTGDEAAHAEAGAVEIELGELHGDADAAAAIARWAAEPTGVPGVDRSIQLLHIEFREAQVDPALRQDIVRLGLELEEESSVHRASLNGRPTTSNELDRILLSARDEGTRRAAWEATREIGARLRGRILELVGLRNEQARQLGARDFWEMSLQGQEMDVQGVDDTLQDVERRSEWGWERVRGRIEEELRPLRGRTDGPLRPWDFPDRFFQSMPRGHEGRTLDGWFAVTRIVKLARSFFAGIGLPVDRILDRSDLLPRDRKHPHAFCIGVENPGDVRVLCNLDGNARWMETALHELGHAVYNAGIDGGLPWVLRNPAHTLITEGVAMFFGRLVRDSTWLEGVAGAPVDLAAAAARELAESQLVFARWALVVARFERELYRDPGQDLDGLWWRLASRLQGIERPDGWEGNDWASKIHVACYPAYYQNYLLGELFASQLQGALGRELCWGPFPRPLAGDRRVGAFFSRMFAWGQSLPWREVLRRQTGTELGAEAWARQFGSA